MVIRGIAGVVALAALGGGTVAAPVGPLLRVTGTVTPDPMVIGAQSVYMVTVENAGRGDAENVTIVNNLDPNTTAGLLSDDCALVNRGATVVCGAGLAIPPGSSVTYEIPVELDPALPDGTRVTNKVEVSATGTDGRSTRMINPARARARAKAGPPAAPDAGGSGKCATVHQGAPNANGGNGRPCAAGGAEPAQPPSAGPATSPAHDTDPARGTEPTRAADPAPVSGSAPSVPSKPDPYGSSAGGGGTRPGSGQPPALGGTEGALHVIHGGGIIKGGPTAGPHRRRPGEGRGSDEQPAAEVGSGQRRPRPSPGEAERRDDDGAVLPLTGVSVWLVGLGVPMLVAIGLLVWQFSGSNRRRPGTGRSSTGRDGTGRDGTDRVVAGRPGRAAGRREQPGEVS
ncbi:hypothetical protein [Nonomuraea helvata]|uniref:DUF11 domain-containing protein n=1 Tax=Nonomuraea helvata TaxID=37484 RepID=A0ABV5SD55_9ACTN